jgi:hypothetical protein
MRINMKIRNGFVSNSSSSSFVIFGKAYNKESLQKKFNFTSDEMEDIDENGLYDYMDRCDGYDYQYLSHDQEWIIGKTISGIATEVIRSVATAEQALGEGCRVYSGINANGEVQLDSY